MRMKNKEDETMKKITEITADQVADAIMNSDTVAFEDCGERGEVLYFAHIKV